jgi:hypothetical protein
MMIRINPNHGIAFTRNWMVRAPWCKPLFSERNGFKVPVAKMLGFRLFRLDPKRLEA